MIRQAPVLDIPTDATPGEASAIESDWRRDYAAWCAERERDPEYRRAKAEAEAWVAGKGEGLGPSTLSTFGPPDGLTVEERIKARNKRVNASLKAWRRVEGKGWICRTDKPERKPRAPKPTDDRDATIAELRAALAERDATIANLRADLDAARNDARATHAVPDDAPRRKRRAPKQGTVTEVHDDEPIALGMPKVPPVAGWVA